MPDEGWEPIPAAAAAPADDGWEPIPAEAAGSNSDGWEAIPATEQDGWERLPTGTERVDLLPASGPVQPRREPELRAAPGIADREWWRRVATRAQREVSALDPVSNFLRGASGLTGVALPPWVPKLEPRETVGQRMLQLPGDVAAAVFAGTEAPEENEMLTAWTVGRRIVHAQQRLWDWQRRGDDDELMQGLEGGSAEDRLRRQFAAAVLEAEETTQRLAAAKQQRGAIGTFFQNAAQMLAPTAETLALNVLGPAGKVAAFQYWQRQGYGSFVMDGLRRYGVDPQQLSGDEIQQIDAAAREYATAYSAVELAQAALPGLPGGQLSERFAQLARNPFMRRLVDAAGESREEGVQKLAQEMFDARLGGILGDRLQEQQREKGPTVGSALWDAAKETVTSFPMILAAFGAPGLVMDLATDAAAPSVVTVNEAKRTLVQQYGRAVQQVGADTLIATLPDGRVQVVQFVGDSALLEGTQDPEQTLASVEWNNRAAAEAALEAAGGNREAAGQALIEQGWVRTAQTLPGRTIRHPKTGEMLDTAVVVQLVAGEATAGTLAEEQLHALAVLAGARAEGGWLIDPRTGQAIKEERLAAELARGADHPVIQRMKDFGLRLVNRFRRDPQESLHDTAVRLMEEMRGTVTAQRPVEATPRSAEEQAAAAEQQRKVAEQFDARATDRKREGASIIVLPGQNATPTAGRFLDQFGRPIEGTTIPVRGQAAAVPERQRWQAQTPNREATVAGRWQAVELDELVTSDQEQYDQTLQPRNRRTAASGEQVAKIASRPDPYRLLDSITTDTGAPILDGRRQVISGNGRTLGLRQAYEGQRAEEYRDVVVQRAQELGLRHAALMRRPVLVREVTDTGALTLPELAELSNRPQVMQRSAAEQAEVDAKTLIDGGLLAGIQVAADGSVRSAGNREALRAFVAATGDAGLLDAKGELAPEVDTRVRRGMLAAVLAPHPQARQIVQDVLERGDQIGVRRAADGIMAAGSRLVSLAQRAKQYDLRGALAQAVRDLVEFKRGVLEGTWRDLAGYLAQGDLFGAGRTAESDAILEMLVRSSSAKGTRKWLERYAEMAGRVDTTTADMFGAAPAPRGELLRRAIDAGRAEEQAGAAEAVEAKTGAGNKRSGARAAGRAEAARSGVGTGARYQVTNRTRIHRTIPRLEGGEWKDTVEGMREDPRAYYAQQSRAGMRQALLDIDDAGLDRYIDPIRAAGDVDSSQNLGIVAWAEKIRRLRAKRDKEGARRETLAAARSAGVFGQLLQQMQELPGVTPEAAVDAVADTMEAQGRTLGEPDRQELLAASEADIGARQALVDAEQAFKQRPAQETAQALDRASRNAAEASNGFLQLVSLIVPKTWGKILTMLMQGNALTTLSLVQNLVGNVVNAPARVAAQSVAALSENILHAAGMVRERSVGQPVFDSWAFVRGAARGARQARRIWATGQRPADLAAGGEVYQGFQPVRAWIRMMLKDTGMTPADRAKLLVESTFGVPAEVMFRALSIGDAPFYEGFREMALHELGGLRGLSGEELRDFVLAPDAEADELARVRAKEQVYQGKPGPLAAYLAGFAKLAPKTPNAELNDLVNALTVRPIMLFVSTPLQIAKEAGRFMIPAWSAAEMGLAIIRARSAKAAGKQAEAMQAQRDAFQSWGRLAVGTMMWGAAVAVVKAGLAAGAGGEGEKEKRLADTPGAALKPWHVNLSGLRRLADQRDPRPRVGDLTIDYRSLGLWGLMLNVAARGDETLRSLAISRREPYDPSQQTLPDMLLAGGIGLPGAMLDLAMMKGSYTLMRAISERRVRGISAWMAQYFDTVSGAVLPNQLRAASRMVLPYMPETREAAEEYTLVSQSEAAGREIVNRLATKLYVAKWAWSKASGQPLMLEDLPAKRDLLGNAVPATPEGRNPVVYHLVDTFRAERIQRDDLIADLDRAFKATNDRSVIPGEPAAKLTHPVTRKPVLLTTQQRSRLGQIQGQLWQWAADNARRQPGWDKMPAWQQAAVFRGIAEALPAYAQTQLWHEMGTRP